MSDASLFDVQQFETATQPGTANPATTHSLYRKYRPSSFADDDLVGQEHVVNTLKNAIALDRIAHAYLFCGPRGTGKTTTARLLAKAVNCLDPDPGNRPCNACAACVAINANATTDVIEIDAASNRGIDDIRDLRERVKYAPTQLKSKFYIIDEAHQITGAAANAFLKTLEEPPAHIRFVLATTDPEELLATIVSRCQRFDFRRINLEAMLSRLRTVADREGIAIDDDALPVIARQATGSLRDALGMLDQVAIYRESGEEAEGSVSADTVRTVLGVSRNERVEILARALATKNPAAGLQEVASAVEAGDDIRQLGRQLVAYLRLLLLQKAGGSPDADETARDLASQFAIEDLAGLLRRFSEIDFKAKRSSLPQLPLEVAMVEGAMRGEQKQAVSTTRPVDTWEDAPPTNDNYAPQDDYGRPPEPASAPARPARGSLKDRVRGNAPQPAATSARTAPDRQPSRPESSFSQEPQAAPQPAVRTSAPVPSSPSAASGSSDGSGNPELVAIIDLWPKIRADVKAVNRRIEALLQQVDPAAINGSQLVLVSPYEFHRNRVNSDDVRRVVEDVISRLLGHQVQVNCMSREDAQRFSSPSTSPAPVPEKLNSVDEPPAPVSGGQEQQSAGSEPSSPSLDAKGIEDRLTAARNIFDAEEITD
jgi:DNA polymerase-3 subunit gamma/tau